MIKKKQKNDAGESGNPPAAEVESNDDQMPAVETGELAEQMKALVDAADKATKERDEYLLMAQRVQADFDNFRRRNQNVRRDAYDEGICDMLIKLLPVFDNLDRAIAAQGAEESLREGVQMVQRQVGSVLTAAGVEEIPAEGTAFDPNLHNAVMQESAEGTESGFVTGVLLKGYRMGDKVLRHCMVKVSQ